MHLVVLGAQDGPQRVTVTADPLHLHGQIQARRSTPMSIHHKVALDGALANTVVEYAHALLADHEVRQEWFAVSPADAIAAVQRAVIACAPPVGPATEKRPRARTDIPLKVAKSLQDLADSEGVTMSDLVREAVVLLFEKRELPPPTWKRHD